MKRRVGGRREEYMHRIVVFYEVSVGHCEHAEVTQLKKDYENSNP